jgi:uncharacterized protein (DUF2336 family)
VLEFSPVLDDAELLALLADAPAAGAACALARRRALAPDIADAIGRGDDVDAITVLLRNRTAQVREDTLDALIDRAVDVEAWHEPLVGRPQLSPGAARRLARFVSDQLIAALARRHDLDPATQADLAAPRRCARRGGSGRCRGPAAASGRAARRGGGRARDRRRRSRLRARRARAARRTRAPGDRRDRRRA